MKKPLLSFAISILLLLSFTTEIFAESNSDETVYINKRVISPGLIYTESKIVDKDSNVQNVFTFELTLGEGTKIVPTYGEYIYGADRLTDLVKQEENNSSRVVGAVNADFFSMSTGIPMSCVISNGEIVSSDDSRSALGFYEDGKPIIGKPEMKFTIKKQTVVYNLPNPEIPVTTEDLQPQKDSITSENLQNSENSITEENSENSLKSEIEGVEPIPTVVTEEIKIDYINKYPSIYALYLQTDKFAKTTKSKFPSTEVVLRKYTEKLLELPQDANSSDYLVMNGFYYKLDNAVPKLFTNDNLIVSEIRKNAMDTEIPSGAYVLCMDDRAFLDQAAKLFEGDEITLEISGNESWRNVANAIGNAGQIVRNGIYTDEAFDATIYNGKSPRTAAGITSEGNLVIYAIDGRQSQYSAGISVKTLAEELIELDCVEAVNFDGGGSTTVVATLLGEQNATLQNSPSDGVQRKVSNALLFVNTRYPNGNLLSTRMYPEVMMMLPYGAYVEYEKILGYDENYYPLSLQTTPTLFAYDGALGFDGKKIYSTGIKGNIEVYADFGTGDMFPCGSVEVLDNVDSISLNTDKSVLNPNEKATLNIGVKKVGKNIPCVLSSFTWNDSTLAENYIPNGQYILKTDNVEIDANGIVTILNFDKTITISAYFGDKSASVSLIGNKYPFKDIDTHWAKDYINQSYELGLVNGESTEYGTMFFPDRTFTLAEFCTVMTRLLGYDLETYKNFNLPFYDSDEIANWALPYIKAMYFNGKLDLIIENNKINAHKPVSRLDIMTVVGTLCPNNQSYTNNYWDMQIKNDKTLNVVKLKYANNALSAEIFQGYEDNTIRPYESLTRSQGTAIFIRLIEKLKIA